MAAHRTPLDDGQRSEIARLYVLGTPLYAIQKSFHISQTHAEDILIRQGVRLRKRAEASTWGMENGLAKRRAKPKISDLIEVKDAEILMLKRQLERAAAAPPRAAMIEGEGETP